MGWHQEKIQVPEWYPIAELEGCMGRISDQEKICAVIPAYNEHKTIGEVVQEVRKYVDTVVVVDDGSTDNTSEIAEKNGARVVRHATNKGIGLAVQTGYSIAIAGDFDLTVQLDSDGQHNPKYISQMLAAIKDFDVVIGSRFLNKSYRKYPLVRIAGISFFTRMVNLLVRTKITDVTSGYRMFRTPVLKKLPSISQRHWAVEQTLELGRRGFRINEVSIEMPVRNSGESQFSFTRYALYPPKMLLIALKVMVFRRK